MNEERMTELTQAEDMAFFRADFCIYSPKIYSFEEKKEICNDMMATSQAALDAMREDFERLPPDARAKLLDMPGHPESSRPRGGGTCRSVKVNRSIASWIR